MNKKLTKFFEIFFIVILMVGFFVDIIYSFTKYGMVEI
jgi:hypothetical protein